MTQKEFVNLEKAMQEFDVQHEDAQKERRLLCLEAAIPVLIYLPIFVLLLFAADGILYTVIIWLIFGLLCTLPAWQWVDYARHRKRIEDRLKEIHPVVVRSTLSSKCEKELVKHEGSHYKRKRYLLRSYFTDDPREYQMGYWYEWHVLYFPEGRFSAPLNTFTWSKENAMSGKGLFRYAQPGDEFYLLIGQTWYGEPKREILLACPAKLFRWEESEISEADDQTNQ